MTIHSSGQTISSIPHIESTLSTGGEIYEVAARVGGMSSRGLGDVCDRTSEGQASRVYGIGFTVGFMAGIGVGIY